MLNEVFRIVSTAVAAALFLLPVLAIGNDFSPRHRALAESGRLKMPHFRRGVPVSPKGVKTLTSPGGATLRFKEPGKEGVCETTPGVNSYSGYVDLDEDTHMFFWFFEARHNPDKAPLTLWLNGGAGSDSLIGLFEGQYLTCTISPPSLETLGGLVHYFTQTFRQLSSNSKSRTGALQC